MKRQHPACSESQTPRALRKTARNPRRPGRSAKQHTAWRARGTLLVPANRDDAAVAGPPSTLSSGWSLTYSYYMVARLLTLSALGATLDANGRHAN